MKCIGCHKRKRTNEHGICSQCQAEVDAYITHLLEMSIIVDAVGEFKRLLEQDLNMVQQEINIL